MNDSPADCQNREWTEPQRDLAPAVCGFPRGVEGAALYGHVPRSDRIRRTGIRLRRSPALPVPTDPIQSRCRTVGADIIRPFRAIARNLREGMEPLPYTITPCRCGTVGANTVRPYQPYPRSVVLFGTRTPETDENKPLPPRFSLYVGLVIVCDAVHRKLTGFSRTRRGIKKQAPPNGGAFRDSNPGFAPSQYLSLPLPAKPKQFLRNCGGSVSQFHKKKKDIRKGCPFGTRTLRLGRVISTPPLTLSVPSRI